MEGPDTTGLDTHVFRHDELVLVLPAGHRLAGSKKPLAFVDALDEEWISLTSGAAMLQKQQQAALAANRPLRLRMQVRSFDAVCHMVASGLGIALLPKTAADPWARRCLLVARPLGQRDPDIDELIAFLIQPSQNVNTEASKQ